jgi:hypothetical protein
MADRPLLEIPKNQSVIITLKFDEPRTGVNQNGPWHLYGVNHEGVEKSYFASEKAHEMLQHYSKGDTVKIEHKPTGEGRSMYVVSPTEEKPTNKPASNDQAIKWGMAFNNATRLVANTMDITPQQKALLVKEIMPEMFEIACSMPDKVQKKDDDDLPF